MPETPLFNSLSVIIPTYNREKVLAKALEGYLAQSSPQFIHELLVVDDGSTDDTESMVREFGGGPISDSLSAAAQQRTGGSAQFRDTRGEIRSCCLPTAT